MTDITKKKNIDNLFWQSTKIKKKHRSEINKQKPCVIWFTGLSASGKTTIADLLEKKLFEKNKKTYLLDGDNIRHGLSSDLNFSNEDRFENIRRVSEVSKLMVDAGLIVISAFISCDLDLANSMLSAEIIPNVIGRLDFMLTSIQPL